MNDALMISWIKLFIFRSDVISVMENDISRTSSAESLDSIWCVDLDEELQGN